MGLPSNPPTARGTGAGATVSLLYTPLRNGDGKPIASIGLVYRSQAVVPLSGSLLVNGTKIADASTNLVLPQIYTGAIAIWPVRTSEREWKLELDVEYIEWKSNRDLDIHLSSRWGHPAATTMEDGAGRGNRHRTQMAQSGVVASLGCGSPIRVHADRGSRS